MNQLVTNFGQVAITSAESFLNPLHRLAYDERPHYGLEFDDGVMTNWNWVTITAAIRRGEHLFVLDMRTMTERIFLKFDAKQNFGGVYERKPVTGKLEQGVTYSVQAIPLTEKHSRFQPIVNCPTRFVVATKTAVNPIKKTVWVVGLNNFTICQDEIA